MKKIPTLYERDWDGDRSRVTPVVHPGCEWVLAGEGVATRKYDGMCVQLRTDGPGPGGLPLTMFKRHEVKPGKTAPAGFEEIGVDAETGKVVGWVPVGDGPEDRWHRESLNAVFAAGQPLAGTYELLGPKIQGNPEGYPIHILMPHSKAEELDAPVEYEELSLWLDGLDIEGVVWHHPDGRMAKIKLRDFGLSRPMRS